MSTENTERTELFNQLLEAVKPKIVDVEALKRAVFSTRGKRKGLVKTGKPKEYLYAYIWRMARFYSGDDVTLPMTADYDLVWGLRELTGNDALSSYTHPEVRQIAKELDAVAEQLLVNQGIPLRGLGRWAQAIYG